MAKKNIKDKAVKKSRRKQQEEKGKEELDSLESLRMKVLSSDIRVGEQLTYADMCDRLGIDRKTGTSKMAQLKDIGTVCTLEEIKEDGTRTKYIINGCSDFISPLDIMDKTSRGYYFTTNLYDNIFRNRWHDKENWYYFQPWELCVLSGYINTYFFKEIKNNEFEKKMIAKDEGYIDYKKYCNEAYQMVRSYLRSDIDTACRRMAIHKEVGFELKSIGDEYNKTYAEVNTPLWHKLYKIFARVIPSFNKDSVFYMDEERWKIFDSAIMKEINKDEELKGKYSSVKRCIAIRPADENLDEMVNVYNKAMIKWGIDERLVNNTIETLRNSRDKNLLKYESCEQYVEYFIADYIRRDLAPSEREVSTRDYSNNKEED